MSNNKVVHLDVKPDNIFIRRDGEAVLGDLGLAWMSEELKEAHKVSGWAAGGAAVRFLRPPKTSRVLARNIQMPCLQ